MRSCLQRVLRYHIFYLLINLTASFKRLANSFKMDRKLFPLRPWNYFLLLLITSSDLVVFQSLYLFHCTFKVSAYKFSTGTYVPLPGHPRGQLGALTFKFRGPGQNLGAHE